MYIIDYNDKISKMLYNGYMGSIERTVRIVKIKSAFRQKIR